MELKLEDEINKVSAVKMANKISSTDLVHSGKDIIKVFSVSEIK